jgi:hypothetical protein
MGMLRITLCITPDRGVVSSAARAGPPGPPSRRCAFGRSATFCVQQNPLVIPVLEAGARGFRSSITERAAVASSFA